MKQLTYKGYVGSIEVSVDDNVLYGKVLYIRDLVSYEADRPEELRVEFEHAVDDYLADCDHSGVVPDRPFKGQFNVRISPDLHRELAQASSMQGASLNDYVQRVLSCHNHVQEDGTIVNPVKEIRILVQPVSSSKIVEAWRSNSLSDLSPPLVAPKADRKPTHGYLPIQEIGMGSKHRVVQ